MTTPRERPILFNGPMVRAILDGRKTQTRRPVKPAGADHLFQFRGTTAAAGADEPTGEWAWCSSPRTVLRHIHCPFGQPGDRLWVRETFSRVVGQSGMTICGDYRATYKHGDRLADHIGIAKRWTPSIHMPRWASRITLEITDVRVQRVQDISEADAMAEGAEPFRLPCHPAREALRHVDGFCALWNNTYGPDAWNRNDWVWAVSFKRVTT